MKFPCFKTKAQAHKSKIEILREKADRLGWKHETISHTIGLNYSHLEIEDLANVTGIKSRQVEVLHQLRHESKQHLSALLSYSEQHY